MNRIQQFRLSKKKYLITAFLILVLIGLFIYSYINGKNRTSLVYADELEREVLEVNGQVLTLRDMAFYVAYEEDQVERQAVVYEPENPKKYWNTYTNHTYIRTAARNAAIQMAIHDEIFYQMALDEQLQLTDEENAILENYIADFWADMTDADKEVRLGVSYEDIAGSMTKIAYAEKMQRIYAELNNRAYEDYEFTEGYYEELLKEQDYTIYKNVWNRIPFGEVTLQH